MRTEDGIVVLSTEKRPIDPRQLVELYASEPWWPERSEQDIAHMLVRFPAVGAWHGDTLIGFARVVSDGRFRAYIEDVLVLKDFRNRGVGRLLMESVLDLVKDIHVVTLFCQKRLSRYYTLLGFKEFSKQVVMHLRNVR